MYCLESVDNGENLSALSLDIACGFEERPAPELPPGAVKILAEGFRRAETDWEDAPYRVAGGTDRAQQAVRLVAVPYHLWGNRDAGEMSV